MNRAILKSLQTWKISQDRKPLVINGARQIGKSYAVREFGKAQFKNIVEVNLEANKALKSIFSTLDPLKICAAISLELNQPVVPGETLLFLDEIQESSEALLSLRYFYEKMPDLHVISAGSLLDIALDKNKDIRMPVGRIEFLYMYPLSFLEFLEAREEKAALEVVGNLTLTKPLPEVSHNKLLSLFNEYILCGGMPAVVKSYVNSPTDLRFRKIQADLIQTYKEDFRKYRTRIDYEKLEFTFSRLPNFIAKSITLKDLCPDYSQSTTRNILNLLRKARVIHAIKTSLANGIPLGAEVREKDIKVIFIDIGLLNSFSDLKHEDVKRWNHDLINSGSLAEQVVGQELLAYSDSLFEPQLYTWSREKAGSSAALDYLITQDQEIVPIEVKAGSTGRLISMRIFMEAKQVQLGARISQHQLSWHQGILSVPIYAVSRVGDLIREAKGKPNSK